MKALETIDGYDLVLCGTGSSDMYSQVVGIQVGALLGIPALNNVTDIQVTEDGIEAERTLENIVERFALPLPAVLSVSSEINVPGVPAMRDILKAGKKPVDVVKPEAAAAATAETLSQLAPEQQERRQNIIEGDNEEAVDALVSFLKKEAL